MEIETTKPTERTTSGLRDALFDELDALRSNKSTPDKARAMANLAGQIIAAASLDLSFHRHVGGGSAPPRAIPALALGRSA